MHARWCWWVAFVSALVLIAQIPAQAVDESSTATATTAPPVTQTANPPAAPAEACASKAPSDPPVWEKSLPIAQVSSQMSASDPGCVSNVARTADSVRWQNPDGTMTANMYNAPMNYQAADGSWQPIDTRLVADGDGVTNKAGAFEVHLANDASSSQLARLTEGDASLSFSLEGEGKQAGGVTAPSQSVGTVGGDAQDTMTYGSVFPNVDLRYQVLGTGLKEVIVVNAPLGAGVQPAFDFGVSMHGVTAQTADDGTVQFVDTATNNVLFSAPSGIATDADGVSTPVTVKLLTSSDPTVAELEVTIEPTWLADPARAFPITIDPTLTDYVWTDAYVANSTADKNTTFFALSQYDGTVSDFVDDAGTNSGEVFRGLQKFDLSAFAGAYIVSAKWYAHAASVQGTTPVVLTLSPINGTWDPSTVTWNTQPAYLTNTATTGGFTAHSLHDADITSWVQNFADGTWTNHGLVVKGPSTGRAKISAEIGSNPAYIQVNYDAYPRISRVGAGGVLSVSEARSSIPTLAAEIDDTDTQSGLYGTFSVSTSSTGTPVVQSGTGSMTDSGGRSSWTLPTALSDGTYYFQVTPHDGITETDNTPWYPFVVDTTGPNTPTVGITGVTANTWTSAGGTATVNLGGNGSSDIHGFYWGLDVGGEPTTLVAASSNAASFSITPAWGWHDLAVRSIDNAGNLSPVAHFTFGWGTGGLTTPTENTFTQGLATLQANAPSTVNGMTVQYRRSETDPAGWQNVPTTDVTLGGSPISSWPVTTTPGTNDSVFPTLVWNAASTLGDANGSTDGPIQIQVGYSSGGGGPAYSGTAASITDLTLDQQAFGSSSVSEQVGPGRVNLLTGNLELDATDASTPAGDITRTFQSLDPATSGGVFGPGWSSSFDEGSANYEQLDNNGDTVVVTAVDGTEIDFSKNSDGTYAAPDGSDVTLTNSGGQFLLKELTYETDTFTNEDSSTPDIYVPTVQQDSTDVGDATTSWQVVAGVTRPTEMSAAVPGVDCTTSPLTTEGCRTFTFTYATTTTATGTIPADWGTFVGQVESVQYTGWDSDLGTPATQTVADYTYDNTGLLRGEWDPRIIPALETTYSYDVYGHVASIAPPGEYAWTFSYTPLALEPASTGRLSSVSRPALPTGASTTTIVYQIPLATAVGGPYNMQATDVARWAQEDDPAIGNATAIYPPDQIPSGTPPSSYARATVYYLDAQGQLVNVASPANSSTGVQDITTSEYDNFGNPVRTLTAADRNEALASSSDTAQQASTARILDTENIYSPNGALLTDTYGPAHIVDLPGGEWEPARQHVKNMYDQGVPSDLTADEPFNLVTTTTESAAPLASATDVDGRTTELAYADSTTGSELGWTLGMPLATTVDPGTGHLNLTTTTLYDANGQTIAHYQPANTSGGDAHETDFGFYQASGASSPCATASAAYAGLPCAESVAAQPSGGIDVPSSVVTKYNMYDEPEITIDTDGSVTRTTAIGYDTAGRQTSRTVTTTGGGVGTTTPTVTTTYDTATGLPHTTATSSPAETITRVYDALGRLSTYTDADGNVSNYSYDLLDRVSTINDGKGTTMYTYDDVGGEERGLATTISDSLIGTFTATYNADGQLATQTYPGGLSATYTYNEVGEPTNLAYAKGSGFWPDSPDTYDIHGEATSTQSHSIYNYSYDLAGRLTNTYEQNLFGCTSRAYAFDADGNRTSLVTKVGSTWDSNPDNCPPSGTGTTATLTYDGADHLNNSGYTYDSLGRTTTVPAAGSLSAHATTLGYYTNDLEHTATTNGITTTYNIDPNQRDDTFVSSADGQIHTAHYSGDGDSAAWTSENTAATVWDRYLSTFGGMAASINQAGTVTLDLINLHGDVIAPAATADTTWNLSATQTDTGEYGVPITFEPPTGARYDYLGTDELQRDTNSGLELMGARLYNPETGSFLQTDPEPGSDANAYGYANGNPVGQSDPSGASSIPIETLPSCYVNAVYRAPFIDQFLKILLTGAWADCTNTYNPGFGVVKNGVLRIGLVRKKECSFLGYHWACDVVEGTASDSDSLLKHPDGISLLANADGTCEKGSHQYRLDAIWLFGPSSHGLAGALEFPWETPWTVFHC